MSSRERPAEPPRAVPDAQRWVKHETPRQRKAREDLERLKGFSGPGFMGNLMATFEGARRLQEPVFIRRGYEAGIIDEVNQFYRSRGWRRRHCRPGATFKERLNASRGGRHKPGSRHA